jgi:Cysteine-rich secretory protein family
VKLVVACALVAAACAPTSRQLAPSPSPPPPPSLVVQHATASPRYAFADATPLEQKLFAAINDARAAAGVAALGWNEQVSFVAHTATSPQLDLGQLAFASLTVDLAIADDVHGVVASWLGDDHRRAQLLDPSATQVGVGVKLGSDGRVAATAVTFHAPPAIDTASFATRIAAKLESRERKLDPELRSIAQAVADQLSHGATRPDVEPFIQSRLRGIDRRWTKIRHSMTRLADPANLERDDRLADVLLHGDHADDVGVGVAQGTHPAEGDGSIWVVVLYAETPDEVVAKPHGESGFAPH